LLRRERKNKPSALHREEKETLNELSVDDVFARRLSEEQWESEDDKQRAERLTVLFKQLVSELEDGEQA